VGVHLALAVFVRGVLVDDFNINLDSVSLLVVLVVVVGVVVVIVLLVLVIFTVLLLAVLALLSQSLASMLDPSLEGHTEVHHRQEGVDPVLLLDDVVVDVIVRHLLALVLGLHGQHGDVVLIFELDDLHPLGELELAVLFTHAPVEQLVEVDIALVRLDAHLEDVLLELSIVVLFSTEPKTRVLGANVSQLSEEPGELVLLDHDAVIPVLSKPLPHLEEGGQVRLELGDLVVLLQVVLLELLDNDQNEKVEHDVSTEQHHEDEVPVRDGSSSTCHSLNASILLGP